MKPISFFDHIRANRRELSPYIICHATKFGWQPYSSFKSMWHKALKNAGFKDKAFQFKEMRHLANTCMKDAGIIVDKIMAMTGHTTIKANESYTHKSNTDTIDASKSLSFFKPEKF